MVPELGKDPFEEFKEVLNDPLGEKKESNQLNDKDKEAKGREDGRQSGSKMLL